MVVGCKGGDDDVEPAVVPKAVAFEGKADPAYAGTWTSTDGSSVLDLQKDGGVAISQTSASVNGKSTSRVKGRWLVSGGDLLFQYTEKSGGETTVKYGATLAGKELALKHGSTTTNYLRH